MDFEKTKKNFSSFGVYSKLQTYYFIDILEKKEKIGEVEYIDRAGASVSSYS